MTDLPSPRPSARRDERPMKALNPSEHAILRYLASGWSNQRIGDETGRSPNTIKKHVENIGAKLRCGDRAGIVGIAYEAGLLRPHPEMPTSRDPVGIAAVKLLRAWRSGAPEHAVATAADLLILQARNEGLVPPLPPDKPEPAPAVHEPTP